MPQTPPARSLPTALVDRSGETAPDDPAADREASAVGAPIVRPARARRRGAWLWPFLRTLSPGPARFDAHRQLLAAAVCGMFAMLAVLVHLFVPTPVGVADNGDGQGLLCRMGLATHAPFSLASSGDFYFPTWTAHQWHDAVCQPAPWSSQQLLARAAQYLTGMLGLGPGLDTRVLGVVCALLFGLLVAAFVVALPGAVGFRILCAVVTVVVMGDGVFTGFFSSAYSVSAALLGLFALLVAFMMLWRSGRVTLRGLLAAGAVAAFAVSASPPLLSALPGIAAALLWQGVGSRSHAASRRQCAAGALARRIPAMLIIAALAAAGAVNLATTGENDAHQQRLYDAVFLQILPNSPIPGKDLQWFGVDPAWARSSGAASWSPASATLQDDWPQFATHVTDAAVLGFYANHPNRLIALADQGLAALSAPSTDGLGSYPKNAGHPAGTREHRFTPVQSLSVIGSAVPLLALILQLVAFSLAIAVASRRRLGTAAVSLGRAVAVMIVVLWSLFWVILLTGGPPEIPLRMLPVTFLSALCPLFILMLGLVLARPGPPSDDLHPSAGDPARARHPVEHQGVQP